MWIKFNDVSFNKEWVRKFKTEKAFLKEMDSESQKHIFASSESVARKSLLIELYKLCLEAP